MLPQPKWQNCLILDGDYVDTPFCISKPFYGQESQISVHHLGTESLKLLISISNWLSD